MVRDSRNIISFHHKLLKNHYEAITLYNNEIKN